MNTSKPSSGGVRDEEPRDKEQWLAELAPGELASAEQRIVAALLNAVRRPLAIDPIAEERALAAFRSARLAGPARTRRCDDWRPGPRLRRKRAWRIALVAFVASIALGGVAYAAYVNRPDHGNHDRHPVPLTSPAPSPGLGGHAAPGDTRHAHWPSASADPSWDSAGPGAASYETARCRVYLGTAKKHPHHRSAAGYQRLAKAAGGADRLPAYCTELLLHRGQGKDTHGFRDDTEKAHGRSTPGTSSWSGHAAKSDGTTASPSYGADGSAGTSSPRTSKSERSGQPGEAYGPGDPRDGQGTGQTSKPGRSQAPGGRGSSRRPRQGGGGDAGAADGAPGGQGPTQSGRPDDDRTPGSGPRNDGPAADPGSETTGSEAAGTETAATGET